MCLMYGSSCFFSSNISSSHCKLLSEDTFFVATNCPQSCLIFYESRYQVFSCAPVNSEVA